MKPILLAFHLPGVGEITFPAYFTLLALGFAVATFITWREAKRIGLDRDLIIDANLWMVVMGVLGARVLHVIADGHFHEYVALCLDPTKVAAPDALVTSCTSAAQCGYDYLCDAQRHVCYPPRDCLAALKIWRGGLAYYGGFLFAVPFCIWFVRRHRLGVGRVADLSAPAIALGLFFGRMGCFFTGCCYGKPTDSPLGVRFPVGSYSWRAQLDAGLIRGGVAHPVHPTQLYEAIACLALFALLYFVARRRKRRAGEVFAWLLVGYALLRSVIEVWRDDDRGLFFGGHLSTSQLLSLPLGLAGLFVLWRLRVARRREEAASAAPPSSAAAPPPVV